ncbi:hypothetical protein HDU96_001605 [Phlyctochytrium bullatum]|nr:hypothetical protein HDU96_001605 [Phlyctochytrium bullatum]
MHALSFLVAAALAFAGVSTATPVPGGNSGPKKCPPAGFDAVTEFSLDAYLGQWYIQSQAPTQYLPVEQNYCVSALYTKSGDNTISIYNFSKASVGSINGRVQATVPNLKGTIRDASRPSKLSVGPSFLPASIAGPYWVVATGPIIDGQYQWALVSGGAPSKESNGKCLANENSVLSFLNGNGQGLWIFTRAQVADAALVTELKGLADSLGLDSTAMNDVAQAGCVYN